VTVAAALLKIARRQQPGGGAAGGERGAEGWGVFVIRRFLSIIFHTPTTRSTL